MDIETFIEILIKKIKKEGLLGSYYSETEREDDLIDMIWDVYHTNIKEGFNE